MSRQRSSRGSGITPATVLMAIAVLGFMIALAATRMGMDIIGPWLAPHIEWLKP